MEQIYSRRSLVPSRTKLWPNARITRPPKQLGLSVPLSLQQLADQVDFVLKDSNGQALAYVYFENHIPGAYTPVALSRSSIFLTALPIELRIM